MIIDLLHLRRPKQTGARSRRQAQSGRDDDQNTLSLRSLVQCIRSTDNKLEQSNFLQETMLVRLGWSLTRWSAMQFVRHCILASEGPLVGQARLGWNQKSVIDL